MSHASRLVSQAAWASGGQLAQALLATVGLVLLVRLLGVEAYGIFALGLLFTGFADVFVGGHTADVLVQRSTVTRRHECAAFLLTGSLALCAAIVIVAAAPLAAETFAVPELAPVLRAMAVLPLLTGLSAVPAQLLVRRTAFAALAKINGACAAAAVLTGVGLAIAGAGIWSLVAMETVRRTLSLALLLTASRWQPGLATGREELAEVFAFAWRRVENLSLSYISQHALPRVFLAEFLGPAALGYYAVARRLLEQHASVRSGPAAAVAVPAVSQWRQDPARLHALIASAIRLTTWAYWPAVTGLVVIAPTLLPLALGPEWTSAVPMLQLLALGSLRIPVASFNTAVLVGFGRMRWISLISLASIAFAVPALWIGVQYGLTGVAAALAVRQWAMWPLGAALVWRASGFAPWRQLSILAGAGLPALIMAAIVAAVGAALPPAEPAALVAVQLAAGLLAYPLAWAACNPGAAAHLLRALTDILAGDTLTARSRIGAIVGTTRGMP